MYKKTTNMYCDNDRFWADTFYYFKLIFFFIFDIMMHF